MPTLTSAVIRSTRPTFLALAPICVLLGIAAGVYLHGTIVPGLAALVVLGSICAHTAANAFNEYFDFASGLDLYTQRTPYSGGSGALPALPKAHKWVLAAAIFALTLTLLIGLYLATQVGPALIAIGALGVLIILIYTRTLNRLPWLCLIAPGFAFGPLVVLGTYLSVSPPQFVTLSSCSHVLLIALVPFFLVNNLLLLNQLPDIDADRRAGRRTFPIRYGAVASLEMYRAFLLAAGAALFVAVLFNLAPKLSLIALICLPLGYGVYRGAIQAKFRLPGLLPHLGRNVVVALLTPFLYSLALIIDSTL